MTATRILVSTVMLVSLCGCASIMSGKTDTVIFNSTPNGAAFTVTDENGKSIHHGTTPATVPLDRGNGFFNGQT